MRRCRTTQLALPHELHITPPATFLKSQIHRAGASPYCWGSRWGKGPPQGLTGEVALRAERVAVFPCRNGWKASRKA
ncbi:hypothetical protein VFPBJ_07479 [Purpureocillium lilacinum]|uniref:Uncharacterized protein n=1 Tax=Purpureocillium lilacinum TaxID=33203 RepID=A0A179GGM2_PURLI|nr:hypothetical protein VFPBJ_07479 [Purpureocillium lilacinum]